MNLNRKKEITADVHERFSKSKIVIVTDYKGLDVMTMNDLRTKLRDVGVEYQVVKNTLLIRASEDTDVALIKDCFKGPSAIAMSFDDPVAPAKVLSEFAKAHGKLEIKAGVMGSKVLDTDAIKALSKLPSREVLLAQVLSAMNAVPTSFVTALSDLPRKLLNVFNAIREQKEAA